MPIINEEGHIFKKQNDNGLYWVTQDKEKDLTKTEYPLYAENGNKDEPAYSFKNNKNTGIYKIPLGGIGISIDGINEVSIEKNGTFINSIKSTDINTQTIK